MRDRADPRFEITVVATYVDDTAVRRLWVGVTGMARSAWLIGRGRVDVVHVHLAHRGSVVRKAVPLLVARAWGVPAVVHAHSFDFAGWFDELGPRAQGLVRWTLRAQLWLVLGDGIAEQYRRRLGRSAQRVTVLRNPVRLPSQVPDRDGAGRVVLVSLGRIGERKGSYVLAEAVARLPDDVRSQLSVVLAGDGELGGMGEAVERLGLHDVVSLRAWLDPAERDALLASAEIFALPSTAEGLPMALLESMAWGLVPVVTPVGAMGEVVHDGVDAVVIAPGDVPALAGALEMLVCDPRRRRAMGVAARARAADFDVELWFERLVAEWTQLRDDGRR